MRFLFQGVVMSFGFLLNILIVSMATVFSAQVSADEKISLNNQVDVSIGVSQNSNPSLSVKKYTINIEGERDKAKLLGVGYSLSKDGGMTVTPIGFQFNKYSISIDFVPSKNWLGQFSFGVSF